MSCNNIYKLVLCIFHFQIFCNTDYLCFLCIIFVLVVLGITLWKVFTIDTLVLADKEFAPWKVRTEFLCSTAPHFRDSSVGIATDYGLDGPRNESRWGEIFRTRTDRPWGPPSLLYNGYWVFPGGKATGRGAGHPTPSSAEVENE
jgi:hypothetical protein